MTVADAARAADVIMILTPDVGQGQVYHDEIEPNLKPGDTLMFAHGFNIRFGQIKPPAQHRREHGRAQGPRPPRARGLQGGVGRARRSSLCSRTPAARRSSQSRWPTPRGMGCTRAGVLETTFTEETETDLFGEQAVLCGGVTPN
jgi:ketol-acid reductoisomerase